MDNRDEAAIRARAYQLWVESGHADGYQDQHWRQAEREVAERGIRERGAVEEREDRAGATQGGSVPARGQRHSDGMSAHPSVLDPAPRRQRA